MRRFIAGALCASLLLGAPGFDCYRAFGQALESAAAGRGGNGLAGAVAAAPLEPGVGPLPASLLPGAGISAEPLAGVAAQAGHGTAAARSIGRTAVALPAAGPRSAAAARALARPLSHAKALAAPFSVAADSARENLSRPGVSGESARDIGRRLQDGESLPPDAVQEGSLEPSRSNLSPYKGSSRQAAPKQEAVAPAPITNGGLGMASGKKGHGPSGRALPAMLSALKKAWTIARGAVMTISLGLALQTTATPAAPPAAQSPPAPQAQAPQKIFLPSPVSASVSIDRQGVTVGDRVRLTVTLRNGSNKPAAVDSLRSAIEDALPEEIEILDDGGDERIDLAPGETKSVVFELVAFGSGELKISGAAVSIPVAQADGSAGEAQLVLPEAVLSVKTVLTPDWKEIGFKDIAEILAVESPDLYWLAAIPLALLLLFGVERLVALKKLYPKVEPSRLPLLAEVRARIGALETSGAAGKEFYAELYAILTTFLIDYHGLPVRERSAAELSADLKASGKLTSGQLSVAAKLARRADAVRFGGRPDGSEDRRQDLNTLKDLIAAIAKSGNDLAAPGKTSAFSVMALLPAAGGLAFGNPWALLLFIPLAGWLLWRWLHRGEKAAFTVSSSALLPRKKSLRQSLSWLPSFSRIAAVSFLLLALARPQLGVTRHETYTPSADTELVLDVSGSMNDSYATGFSGGPGPTKIEAAENAFKTYITAQRRRTSNRIGLVIFNDKAYQALRLTRDYDGLVARLPELKADGGTAIGDAILQALSNLIEINARELNDPKDPRIAQFRDILKDKGLAKALEFAKSSPDLMRKVLQPDRKKLILLFTDGDSNVGVAPLDVARLIQTLDKENGLNARIYSVGIAQKGVANPSGYSEPTLKGLAEATGGRYFRADDSEGMQQAVNEIDRMEKSPSLDRSRLEVNEYQDLLYLLALLTLGLELGLSSTALRKLPAYFLLLPLPFVSGPAPDPQDIHRPQAGIVRQLDHTPRSAISDIQEALPTREVPPDVAEANRLYMEGRFDEALKKYHEAAERRPDMPEIYFNMGNAYLRLGDAQRAGASYEKLLAQSQDPALRSKALFNMGNAALAQQDAEQALDRYKQALLEDSGNFDAKWNLEALRRMQKEQQQNQDGRKNQKQKNGKSKQKGGQKQGQPGDPKGDQKGQPQAGDKGDKQEKSGVDQLIDKIGRQEQAQKEDAKKGIVRKGDKAWGALALPFAFGGGASLTFSSPLWLWAAAILAPALVALLFFAAARKLKAARALWPGAAPKSFRSWPGKGRWLAKTLLVAAAAGLLGVAAAGPKSGLADERVNFGGKDIAVAVDGSQSMVFSEDGRIGKEKAELIAFASRLQGTDRLSLVVFAGQARTASPLSIDYGNFEFKIERLEQEAVGLSAGSNLADAVKKAIDGLESAKKLGERGKMLIVLSDGEIFDQDLSEAVKTAKEHNVAVYTIGIGSEKGAKMKVPTEDGKGTEYVIDSKTGEPAVTRLHKETLEKLSAETGGQYFPAGEGVAINRVLDKISALEKGRTEGAILSPRSVGSWFAFPALLLLLLDLLLPAASVFNTEKAGKLKSGSAPMLGLAFLPLSAWPQLLPFAVLVALGAALLLWDAWTGGSLLRRARWALQRRCGVVEGGLARDLGLFFDLREADQARLADFMKRWREAPKAAGRGSIKEADLIKEAAADSELWRQKLAAACLAAHSPETQDAVFAALAATAKDRLEPLDPVVRGLLARRKQLGWLDHVDAARRLSRLAQAGLDLKNEDSRAMLAELAAYPDAAVSETAKEALGQAQPEKLAPKPSFLRRWRRRAALGSSVALAAGALTFAGAAGFKTYEYSQRQAEASEASLRIFYGEDVFIFTDSYLDDRIPSLVLPALRRWHAAGAADRESLELALDVLRQSPDPKADNVLEAVFKRADFLPLTERAETNLLTILIERDNDEVWSSMEKQMAQSSQDAGMLRRMKKMIALGAQLGTERTFYNLFHFLKSPNPGLRGQAAAALRASLLSSKNAPRFYGRLLAVESRYAEDPVLCLWVEIFLLERQASGPPRELDAAKARQLLDALLDAGAKFAAARAQIFAAAKPGEESKIPASYLEEAFGLMEQAERQALQGQDPATTRTPAPLAELVKSGVNRTATELIKEGDRLFPGLLKKLFKSGVANGNGGWGSQRYYRELYKLGHLRALAAQISQAGSDAAAKTALTPEQTEFLDRAAKSLAKMETAGKSAGMLEGDSPGEQAAEELMPVLKGGVAVFSGDQFLRALRAASLAPDNGATGDAAYQESYSREDLAKLLRFLKGLLESGNGWDYRGASRELTWAEKKYLAGAIDAVEAAAKKSYPAPAKPASGGDGAFFRSLNAPGEEENFLPRLAATAERNAKDEEFQLKAIEVLAERLESPAARSLKSAEVEAVMGQLFEAAGSKEAEFWSVVAKALKGRKASPQNFLAKAVRAQTRRTAEEFIARSESAFPDLLERFLKAGLLLPPSHDEPIEYHSASKASSSRDSYKLRHLRELGATISEARSAAAAKGSLSADQSKLAERVENVLPKLLEAAGAAGLPSGDSPGEIAADGLNAALMLGAVVFNGGFLQAARPGGKYAESYTRAEMEKILRALKSIEDTGQGWDFNGHARAMDWSEKRCLAGAVLTVAGLIDRIYPDAARPAAPAESSLLAAQDTPLFSARVAALSDIHAGDGTFQLEALNALIDALSGPRAEGLNAYEAEQAMEQVFNAAQAAGKGQEAWALAERAVKEHAAASKKDLLSRLVLAQLPKTVKGLISESEDAFPALRGRLDGWRAGYKLRHLRELAEAVENAAAEVRSSGRLNGEQAQALALARDVLPQLIKTGETAGLLPGDDPAEIVAGRVINILYANWQKFTGQSFLIELRRQGLAPQEREFSRDKAYFQAYSMEDIVKLRLFLQGLLDSGQGWESVADSDTYARRPLTADERKLLEDSIQGLDKIIKDYPGRKSAALHGLSPLGLALAWPAAYAPALAAAALTATAVLLAYAVRKAFLAIRKRFSPAAPKRDKPSDEVYARYKKIDIAARKLAASVSGGTFRSLFIGAGGTDFADAKPYAGEDMRELDWKATAKAGELFVKKFELEKDMPLVLLIDLSRSSRFGTRGTDKRTVVEDAAAVLALAAARGSLRVGAVILTDKVEEYIPPGGGEDYAWRIIRRTLAFEPGKGRGTDLNPALKFIGEKLPSRAMVAVLSDFIAPEFQDALAAAALRHDVRPVLVSDPAEARPLPKAGLLTVRDAETGELRLIDTSSAAARAEQQASIRRREEGLAAAFKAARVRPVEISTEGKYLDALESGFQTKKKR